MKINISIEARMTSSRLPKKVLMPINGTPCLEIMINRIKKSKFINNIIIATTTNKEDDEIIFWCDKHKIDYYRGNENNIYQRVLDTHIKYNSDIIVELTGDCPLLDSFVIDRTIQTFLDNNYDYVATGLSYPLGMAVQVYTLDTLKSVSKNRELTYEDKEHVSPYLYTSGKYNTFYIKALENEQLKDLSVTLDTNEDFEVIQNICRGFDNFDFSLNEIVDFALNNPELVSMNKNIHRKGLS
ncbi:MAG: glycosyltransferase family protein [Arcobacteraceae bacterium]|nr:glycosyltransferase family protein [Arcobacteraceae bacterium]